MSVNDDLRRRAVIHAHLIERLKAGEVRRIVGMLNRDVYPALAEELAGRLARIEARGFDKGLWTTERMKALKAALDEVLSSGFGAARRELEANLQDAAVVEARAQIATLTKSVPLEFEFTVPSPATLRSVVTARPFQGRILRDWWGGIEQATRDKVRATITRGLVEGESSEAIVRNLVGTKRNGFADGVLEESRRGAAAVVRTAVNHTMTHASEATYEANDDIVKGVQWVSTLDSGTTVICMSLDGQVFQVGEGPRPPAHWGCRSRTTPVLKSWQELGIPAKEIKPGTRASMNGQVPETQTYADWLKDQPKDVQDEALGPERAAMWRRGEVTISQMVGSNLEPLTLAQLRRKLGLAA